MSKGKRLGDLLVEAGFVTRLHVDQALQAQQIFGDRLGTNLIEMGAIDGNTLASFLAQQYGVKRVTLDEMENIPKEILDLVPPKAAHRLCMMPVRKEGDRLILVMLEPNDTKIIKRVETNLKVKIEPRVAAEVEISYFLEKHYGIRREMRHIRLMNRVLEDRLQKKEVVSPTNDILTSQLDRFMDPATAMEHFFKEIKSLEKVPSRIEVEDITKLDLTPELAFLYLQIDGLSNLADFLASSPFSRITTLRAVAYLSKLGLLRFENP